MIGKRGQREVSLGTFLLLILGVGGLILVGYGFYNYWSKIDNVSGVLPSEVEAAAQGCKIAATGNLVTAFCDDFKELKMENGGTHYMTCDYLKTQYSTDIGEFDVTKCTSGSVTERGTSKCGNLTASQKEKAMANGVSCEGNAASTTGTCSLKAGETEPSPACVTLVEAACSGVCEWKAQ